jgi:Flp pilus assembly protein protease CpaA
MATHLQFAALIGFVLLMTAAAFEDFRRLMIPNCPSSGFMGQRAN